MGTCPPLCEHPRGLHTSSRTQLTQCSHRPSVWGNKRFVQEMGKINSDLEKRKLAGKLTASSQHPQLLQQKPFGSVARTPHKIRAIFQAAGLFLCRILGGKSRLSSTSQHSQHDYEQVNLQLLYRQNNHPPPLPGSSAGHSGENAEKRVLQALEQGKKSENTGQFTLAQLYEAP